MSAEFWGGGQKCGFCFLFNTHCSSKKIENFVWNSFLTFDIFQELDLPSTNYFMTNSFLLAFLSLVCRWSCQKILWFLNLILSFKISSSVHDRVDWFFWKIFETFFIFQNSRFLNDFSRSNYLILKVHDRDHISVSLNFSIWGVFFL